LKSGKNWQFHLGSFKNFEEKWAPIFIDNDKVVRYSIDADDIISDFVTDEFIKTFMLKGNFFVVYDFENWLIFDSKDIQNLMQNPDKVQWRLLESGRVKGDFFISKGKRTIFTMEYRAESHKRQFVFGAHGGGAGERFKRILKEELLFNSVPVDYELWQDSQ
jgi:hypothetical protein